LLLSYSLAFVGRLTTDLCLNCIQLADPAQCFGGRWGRLADMQIVDLAPGVRLMWSFT
jgi:hypothetical protein